MQNENHIRTVHVTRYIAPLREGGSLPALAEADDDFKYVVKFSGAGQGVKALIAEFIGGEIARALGFKVPEIVLAYLDEAFGRTEGDEEIQDLLKASQGLNLGLHFLSGAIAFDPVASRIEPGLASEIVWLDAYLANIDRTFKNTNMLVWHKEIWLIDHGASLYFHHSWENMPKQAASPFPFIRNHALLPRAAMLWEAHEKMTAMLHEAILAEIVSQIPGDWLKWPGTDQTPEQIRETYLRFLAERKRYSETFTKEAQNARQELI